MATPLSGEPTLPDLLAAVSRAETYWLPQTKANQICHELLYNLHSVESPKPSARRGKEGSLYVTPEKMRSGMGPRIVKRLRSFYAEPPQVSLRPKGIGPRNLDKAAQIKVALDEAVDQATEAAGEPIWGLLAGDVATFGYGVSLVLPAPQVWFDYPLREPEEEPEEYLERVADYEQAAPVPVVWEHIPAREFRITSLGRINDEGFWRRKVPAQEILDRFGPDLRQENRTIDLGIGSRVDPYSEIDLVTYANRTHLVYFLPSVPAVLRSFEHHMGLCPLVVILGLVTGDKVPGRYFQGVLHDVQDLIIQTDKRLSELATASRLDAIPPLAVPTAPTLPVEDEGEAENEPINIQLGGVIPYDPRQTPRPPEWVGRMGQSPVATYAVELGLRLIEETTGLNQAIFGTVGAQEAAAAINLSAEMAKQMYAPMSFNMATGYRRICTAFLRAMLGFIEMHPEDLQDDVRITLRPKAEFGPQISLKRRDLEGWDVLLVGEYEPRLPVHRNANLGLAISLSQAKDSTQEGRPLADYTWIRENLMDEEQGREIDRRWLVDDFVFSQPTIEAYRSQALREARLEFQSGLIASPEQIQSLLAGAPGEVSQTFKAMGLAPGQPAPSPAPSGPVPPESTIQSALQTGQLQRRIQNVRAP